MQASKVKVPLKLIHLLNYTLMGIIEKLTRLTPFYDYYKKYRQQQNDKKQQKFEAAHFPLRISFYKQFLNPNDLVFDVGANVGNRVAAFLECKAKIVAIEPQPNCVQILKEKFGNNISIENVGLSEQVGELEMQIANDSTVSTFSPDYVNKTKDRFKYSKWEKTIKVPVTTIETLITKYGVPKFCKIDVEGFELQVLKGLKTQLPFISIEYCVPEMKDQAVACLKYLDKLSSTARYNYSVGESMKWALKDWQNYHDFSQHIETKEFTQTSFGDIYIKSI